MKLSTIKKIPVTIVPIIFSVLYFGLVFFHVTNSQIDQAFISFLTYLFFCCFIIDILRLLIFITILICKFINKASNNLFTKNNLIGKIKIVILKFLKVFTFSFLGIFLPFLLYFIIMLFVVGIGPTENISSVTEDFLYITSVILTFAPFLTTILFIGSILDKRVLNKWAVIAISAFVSLIGITSQITGYISYIKLHGN